MIEERLAAWRDRRRDPLTFRLATTDPDTGRPVTREYEVPDRPARVWLLALLSDEPADLCLDLLDTDDADELWDEATDPDTDVDVHLLHEIGRALLGRVTGRPWWQAQRLLVTLAAEWHTLDALAADAGLGDLLEWNVERLCAWVYLRLTQNADEQERARLDSVLLPPPDEIDPEEAQAAEDDAGTGQDEGALFFAAMAAFTGGVADEDGVARR